MTKRFDRADGKKVHMQSLGSLAHISYQEPGICGYELAFRYMKELDLTAAEIEQFYRRMVFNVLAVNQDDHVKNVSFLMDRSGEWTLSPAYDITFSYDAGNKWLRAHQMTINGITANDENCQEILQESIVTVTALCPYIGYDKAVWVAKKAMAERRTIKDVVLSQKLLDEKKINKK